MKSKKADSFMVGFLAGCAFFTLLVILTMGCVTVREESEWPKRTRAHVQQAEEINKQ